MTSPAHILVRLDSPKNQRRHIITAVASATTCLVFVAAVAEAGAGLNTSAGVPMAGRGGSVVDKPSMGRGVTGTGALPAEGDVAAAPGHVGADKAWAAAALTSP